MRSILLDKSRELVDSYVELAQLYATPAIDFTIPNGTWNTPAVLDWHAPVVVGPNQVWDVIGSAGVRCVTAVHPILSRIAIRTPENVAVVSGAIAFVQTIAAIQPPVITTNFTVNCYSRIATDSSVLPNTELWISQEFNGVGANGRVVRDGNYFWAKAARIL